MAAAPISSPPSSFFFSDLPPAKPHSSSSASASASAAMSSNYSRKEKSLGLLCENFLHLYSNEQREFVSLDDAANRLGVERRRIYDIVNVLESIQILVRKAKNQYTWHGFSRIPEALEALKRDAVARGNRLASFRGTEAAACGDNNESEVEDEEDREEDEDEDDGAITFQNENSASNINNSPVSVLNIEEPMLLLDMKYGASQSTSAKSGSETRREKSLGLLSQKFVQLFLVSKTKIVSLEDAAKVLLEDCNESSHKLKTKIRRLYDIANIFSSIRLIEKTNETKNRKPAFRWLGVKGVDGTCANTKASPVLEPLDLERAKRARCGAEESSFEQKCMKRSNDNKMKPLQSRNSNSIASPIYNPVPCYPRRKGDGASCPNVGSPATHSSASKLNLCSNGGWREWTNSTSQRRSQSVQTCGDLKKKTSWNNENKDPLHDENKDEWSNEKNPCFVSSYAGGGCGRASCQCTNSKATHGNSVPFFMNFLSTPVFCPFQSADKCQQNDSDGDQENCHTKSGGTKDVMCFNAGPLQYQNEVLNQMFGHYMEAWKSWYLQATACSMGPHPATHDSMHST